nr:hypothetical protein [Microctonus hyperodae filamentous virus]
MFVLTNYPYLYKKTKKNTLTNVELENMKCLYICSLDAHSRDSIYEIQRIILNDVKMPYFGLLAYCQVNRFDVNSMLALYKDLSLKNYNGGDDIIYEMCEKNWCQWYRKLFIKVMKKFIIHDDDDDEDISVLYRWIQDWSLTQIYEYKNLTNIKMRNGSIAKQIQGRDSIMRRQILSPKIQTFRGQISLRFELAPNEIILPLTTFEQLKCFFPINNVYEYDLHNSQLQRHKFIPLPEDVLAMIKRDPVLSKYALVYIDRVAFARSDLYYIGPYGIIGQNADFDGDTENMSVAQNLHSAWECRLNLSPQYNMYMGYLKLRLLFTEMHVYYMHKRKLPYNHEFFHRYEQILKLCTVDWLCAEENITNVLTFKQNYWKFYDKQHSENFYLKYIEPTHAALNLLVLSIYIDYGSKKTFEFFMYLNDEIVKNSYKIDEKSIVSECLIDPVLLKIVMSGAKGSLAHYNEYLNTICTRELSSSSLSMTSADDIYRDSLNALRQIGSSARNVPLNGHESFKTIIEFNGISFNSTNVSYNDEIILNVKPEQLFFSHHTFAPTLVYKHFFSL